ASAAMFTSSGSAAALWGPYVSTARSAPRERRSSCSGISRAREWNPWTRWERASQVTTPPPALAREVGASRFDGGAIAHASPTAVPQPVNVASRVVVAVRDVPAMRALVDADGEFLLDLTSALAADLTCATRIHKDELAAGAFCLARENPNELCPRGIGDLFGKPAPRKPAHIEIFDCDPIEASHEPQCDLVVMVEPRATDPSMQGPERNNSLPEALAS